MNNLYKWGAGALLALSASFSLQAQTVGIGTGSPDPSAKLHIVSSDQGLLVPQISIGSINSAAPVTAPAVGLLVWNTNNAVTGGAGRGFYYWNGTTWERLSTGTGTDDQNLTGASLSGNNLTITIENGTPTTVDLSNLVNDADAVIGNEYNTAFAISGRNLTLTDGGGARTVDLSGLVNDADFVIGNEYNTAFALTGRTLRLTDGGGARNVDLTSLVNDADFVIGNEYNTAFALSGRNLTLTDGGGARTVNLTSLVNDADFVIGNEYNTAFALSGRNLRLTDGGGTRTVDLSTLVNDADFVIGNEYNTAFALSGRTLTLTDGGGARNVDLTSLVNDADFVIGNEYNTAFSLSGNNLTLTDGGGARTVSLAALNKSGRNGLRNVGTFIHLGGPLIENTTVSAGTFAMNFNLNSSGDFNIQDNGVGKFTVLDNGTSRFGGDVEWRDENTGGTILAQMIDDGDDGRFIIRENGNISVDLDANSQFVFNEQGFDRDFRVESDLDPNVFRVNAGTNRVGIGEANPTTRLEVTAADGQTLMLSRQDAAITTNEQLGGIGFDGSDGNTPTDIRESSASIIAFASEDHSTGDKGGRLTFWTSPTNQDDNTDGLERLRIDQDGNHYVGGDMYWRDASVTGTNIARMVDDGNDGQMIIYEDGITQILLDANGTSVFNERGLDRNFRIESNLDANNFFVDGGTNRIGLGTGAPAQKLHVVGGTRISALAGAGNRMVVANANGDLLTGAIPANGDITGVNAGLGLTGGGTAGTVTLNAAADNGLNINAAADRIRLGGNLLETTVITQNAHAMRFNLNGTGNFDILDNGIYKFSVLNDGNARFGGDVEWRDESTTGTIIANLFDDGNDGRFIVRENGGVSVDLDANSQFIFNEQGLDRNFRIESDLDANNFFVDAGTNRVGIGTGAPAQKLHVQGRARITDLAGAGNRMVIANANGDLFTQGIPANGDITGVNAGAGLSGGGTAGTVTLNALADNGLYINAAADRIRLGGNLLERTTITNNAHEMIFNLNGTGDFVIQDNGTNHFTVTDNGDANFGSDVYWRDENTGGRILAQMIDDGDDGRFIIRENGGVSIDLDANTQFIFNEQGLDRNFRIESDANVNMFHLDAGLNRVSVGTNATAGTFNVQGTSYHSDDIYLRDGAVNGGDVLVRIFDSADDGIIDVYEDNVLNHRIHGNGTSVFNEQGNNNAHVRMESDTRANMFYMDATDDIVRIGNDLNGETGNGTTVNGIVVDYVADFDNGVGASGTAIGIGSVEYLLDLSSETAINNRFSPTRDNVYDLGSATLRWDDVYATNGTIVTSDEREKMTIQPMSYGLSEIMKLRPVTYKWKNNQKGSTMLTDGDKELKLGLIAQEVQQILPEVVQTHDWRIMDEAQPDVYTREPMDRLGMSYHEITPVLIKAIQEQQAQIEVLKAEIEALKAAKE